MSCPGRCTVAAVPRGREIKADGMLLLTVSEASTGQASAGNSKQCCEWLECARPYT